MVGLRTAADWFANRSTVPTSVRAVAGYYANAGVFDLDSLGLKRRVDETTDAMVEEAFADVTSTIEDRLDYSGVSFSYETKLVLPAQLTLGYLYRRTDDHARAEQLTRLVIEALVEGDMRDALNDEEYADFRISAPVETEERRRLIAQTAQETLFARVDEQFAAFDPAVREAYDWAVDVSEAHQNRDEYFRSQMTDVLSGDPDALETISSEYKHAPIPEYDPPGDVQSTRTDDLDDLAYFKTQYSRVGVIYDGMIEMYRAAGFGIDESFKRSIVLAIVAAQIWLDDIDDFDVDTENQQLTPVTAEYLLADDDRDAYRNIVGITEEYFGLARSFAGTADSHLTGLAVEYIYRSGEPASLPGSDTRGDRTPR